MEGALNLCWIAIMLLLGGSCLIAHRCGALRTSLVPALICCLLLAAVLLPAISMTDDLQCTGLESEGRQQMLLEVLHGVPVQALHALHGFAFAALFACLLALSVGVLARLAGLRSRHSLLHARLLWYRPAAVRPPTLMVCA